MNYERLIVLLLGMCSIAAQAPADELTADMLLDLLKVSSSEREAMVRGEIVVLDSGDELTDDLTKSDLFSGLAVHSNRPFDTVADRLSDATSAAMKGLVVEIPDEGPFPVVEFQVADRKEIGRILDFSSGNEVNLGQTEVELLRAAGIPKALDEAGVARFNEVYRKILEGRHESYRRKGLAGIEPYTRGKKKTQSPGEHLRVVTDGFHVWMKPHLGDFYDDLMAYPKSNDHPQQHVVIRKEAAERPAYALAHRIATTTDRYTVVVHREYFVSHTYDALQIAIVCLPYHDGTLIVLATDAFTDKVAGFGSSLAHPIGRGRVRAVAEPILLEIKRQLDVTS